MSPWKLDEMDVRPHERPGGVQEAAHINHSARCSGGIDSTGDTVTRAHDVVIAALGEVCADPSAARKIDGDNATSDFEGAVRCLVRAFRWPPG